MDDLKNKRFFWGVLLAWSPWVPCLIGLGFVLRGVLSEKATGLAAVAVGFTEMFVLWGIASVLIAQVVAIVFLSRAFLPGHRIRSLVSVASISVSCLMLLLVVLFLWMTWSQAHRAQ